MAPRIGAREIDGLPKASMAELLVISSRTRIHVIGSGKSPTNLEAMSLNYWNIVDFDVISQFMQWIQKSSVVWNQIQLDLANLLMKHVMIIWTHEYR